MVKVAIVLQVKCVRTSRMTHKCMFLIIFEGRWSGLGAIKMWLVPDVSCKSDNFQQVNIPRVRLDHITANLLYGKVLKSSPSFKTLWIRSRQKMRLTPLWASSSLNQFCFEPNSLTVYILGITSAFPRHAYSNRTGKKKGKQLKRHGMNKRSNTLFVEGN